MAIRPDFLVLEAFVAIADRGSFHAAAAHLGITQTALSHRTRKLETYLGAALLHRTTRRVSLTPTGLSLLPRAQALVTEAHQTFAVLTAEAAIRQERVTIVDRLNQLVNAQLTAPEVVETLRKDGAIAAPGTPGAFAAQIAAEILTWREIITRANIQISQ